MNIDREQVIAWAQVAGFETKHDMAWVHDWEITPTLARFAALACAAGAAAERQKLDKERQQYADWFDEAAADIYDWGGYASEYFQEKYDLQANVRDFKNRAVAIRARNNP